MVAPSVGAKGLDTDVARISTIFTQEECDKTSLGLLAQLVSHQRYQGSKSELYTINVTHEASGANWEAICVIRWGFDRSTSRCPIAIKNFTTCTNLSQKREQTYKYPESTCFIRAQPTGSWRRE